MLRADDVWEARGGITLLLLLLLSMVTNPALGIFTVLLIAKVKNPLQERMPLSPWREWRPQILVQEKYPVADTGVAAQCPFQLHQILEALGLTEGPLVSDTIQIDQHKPPLLRRLFFDQYVLILQVTNRQSRGMQTPDKLGQGTEEGASLLARARVLVRFPVNVERRMREQCLTHVETFGYQTRRACLGNSKRPRDGDPRGLEESRAFPRPHRG